MNVVFDVEDYEFMGKLGDVDIGKEFTAYYDHCQPLSYDSDNLPILCRLRNACYRLQITPAVKGHQL